MVGMTGGRVWGAVRVTCVCCRRGGRAGSRARAQAGAVRGGHLPRLQLQRAARRGRRQLRLEEERHAGGGPAGAARPLQAGQRGLQVHLAHPRGRLRQLLVRHRRRRARARGAAARPSASQAAGQLARRGGAEPTPRVQGGGQAVPRGQVAGEERVGRGRQPDGRDGGAGRARRAEGFGTGRAGRRAAADGRAARRRRRVHVPARQRRRGRDGAAREGHVRGAVALPGHLRRGVRAVRHHPGVREAPHQARAGRLGHRQPRAVSASPLPPLRTLRSTLTLCLCVAGRSRKRRRARRVAARSQPPC